ncbi:MAG: peptide deformylase [candidate division KSB1 bacterium]|nr:peptide deformylase [candidate division KSB1 bacterium]MDZ7333777.1 peptide deformylase [candidate division KSB1 bacterium]MDZ7357550.1 peptide deformylase [candidate division KSB1 bacterium]MDZ7400537.1 peptide deformylase [candidate division KSB1 bacterium]
MEKLRIIKYGNPILRMKAKKVEKIDPWIEKLIENMILTMQVEGGIGLAAPQVAESIALLVVDHSLIFEDGKPTAYINPVILAAEGESVLEEGCLSIPEIRAEVKRPEKIRLRYQTVDGANHEDDFDGLLARVLQHEIDHLNGVLFIDRISPLKKQMLKKELKAIADEEMMLMKEVA